MPKQGMHEGDSNDPRVSKGPNKPKESETITTGTYKKPETYKKQAAMPQDPGKQPAQAAKNEWNEDTRQEPTNTGSTRARKARSSRSGSSSNAA
jgi:hypothetical protein